ncbi:MAG: hypothetical protein K0S49_31 [Microbacterium sp.]|jgi:hypothetical protein|nr:hypothetical protein [Microbacterium sp.]
MTRHDPLAWDGNRSPFALREKRRIYVRCFVTAVLVMASLAWGIYEPRGIP